MFKALLQTLLPFLSQLFLLMSQRSFETLNRQQKGRYFEDKARRFLQKQGLKDFQANYSSRYGEIDMIARDGNTLVFIEVRYRESSSHGSALATVNFHKQHKIRLTAQHFLQKNGLTNRMPCRFDVVGITGNESKLDFQWIKNAF